MKDSHMKMELENPALGLVESCRSTWEMLPLWMPPNHVPLNLMANSIVKITELDAELNKFTRFRKEPRRSMRRVMSRTVRALYPFQEDTMRKLRENISRVNEILQQAASSILMYVYGSPVLLFVSPKT
jgi:hypothetical protein